jgi:hypothetical protein
MFPAAAQMPASLAARHQQFRIVPDFLEMAAMGAAPHRAIVAPADILPVSPGAVFPAVQERRIKTAQAEEMRGGNPKSPPGEKRSDAHDHQKPGSQTPGFLPDGGIRQGPGQAHPEPEIAAGLPENHQHPHGPAETRDQVLPKIQELSPPFLVGANFMFALHAWANPGFAPTSPPAWRESSGAGRSGG